MARSGKDAVSGAADRGAAPTAAAAVPPDLSPAAMSGALRAALADVEQEFTDLPLTPLGTLPADLRGVLYRNGPGRFGRGGVRYAHPFDGDGHVVRIAIGADGVRYTNRFVRTAEYRAETAAGRMRYRGFGSNLPGGLATNLLRLHFKNAANTNVVWQGGRLLALWEGGLPHRLDPHSLATLGPEDFQGRLRNPLPAPARWLSPWLPFAAHPRLAADTGAMINFGVVFGRPCRLVFYRIDADGCMAPPLLYPLPRFSFVHDFAVTRHWYCVLLPWAEFDLPRALLGLATPVGSLRLATERPMQALLIPRAGGPPRVLETVPGFVFHIAQGCEDAAGRLALDVIRYPRYPAFDDLEGLFQAADDANLPRLERLLLDPRPGAAAPCTLTPWSDRPSELPSTAPGALGAARRIVYSVGAPPGRRGPYFTAVQRLDTDNGRLQVRDFAPDLPGEPIPAGGASGEDWLLTLLWRHATRRSELLILRAADLAVQARLPLPHAVPPGFHGCWVAATPGSD
ncbi:MAG: lignostilbene alpha-beta-dioxygenase [Chromatiaceae bacterium]|nr:MAG: lignostilbene alpha-beta-dioxygenase [Chromatiaceae bacterium]